MLTSVASLENNVESNSMFEHLDTAIADVFENMMGMTCLPLEHQLQQEQGMTVAICFSGLFQGGCTLYLSQSAALATTEALLGESSPDPYDPMIDDAVGELCNMIVGRWKSRLGSTQAAAKLSVPVTSREHSSAHAKEWNDGLTRSYRFQDKTFSIFLVVSEA